jgi:RNA polymerase sigma-70 factor, ECF subfamily
MPADPDFEKLVDLYYRDLYRFGFNLTRNEADAADLTQQTFYIWARKGHQLRTLANVKGWLFTTLHREFLQTRRCQQRQSDRPLNDVIDEIAVVSPDTISGLDARTMLEFFEKIDESYQAPLVLYYVEDFSYKKIAEVLKIPLGTVESRIARGKMHLHQLLTSRGESKRSFIGLS